MRSNLIQRDLCLTIRAAVSLFTLAFSSRAILGLVGGAIGLSTTYFLHKIAKPYFETSVWTVLLESAAHIGDGPSQLQPPPVSISLLDSWIESIGLFGAFSVLYYRNWKKKSFKLSFASLWCLFFFISTLLLSSGIGFLYARTVDVAVHPVAQTSSASSLQVLGTIDPGEGSANASDFKSYGPTELPPPALQAPHPDNDQTVYFPEIFGSVVDVGGYGYGANKDASLSRFNDSEDAAYLILILSSSCRSCPIRAPSTKARVISLPKIEKLFQMSFGLGGERESLAKCLTRASSWPTSF